jgi:hypothetical protein
LSFGAIGAAGTTGVGVGAATGGGGTEILGSGVLVADEPSCAVGLVSPGFDEDLRIVFPGILITLVLVPPGTVPHGGPYPPA